MTEQALTAELLSDFARSVLREHQRNGPGDVDGGWLQDEAVLYGLLIPVTAHEPCGLICRCVEYDAFPLTCYRLNPALLGELSPAEGAV